MSSFMVLKSHLDEHVPAIKEGADEMTALKREVRWKAADAAVKMRSVGLAISDELAESETIVQSAWGEYLWCCYYYRCHYSCCYRRHTICIVPSFAFLPSFPPYIT
jgi:hypothetical protein